jgi:hypothetical protein
MMVPALVIGKGSSNNNEGCSDKINTTRTMVGSTVVVWCIERGHQYNFFLPNEQLLLLHENLNKSK